MEQNEIEEKRVLYGIKEHRHTNYDYWHPERRWHYNEYEATMQMIRYF